LVDRRTRPSGKVGYYLTPKGRSLMTRFADVRVGGLSGKS
jgi:DNA-binding HxlR family transcriptional regulator